jgi:hypothetical protein
MRRQSCTCSSHPRNLSRFQMHQLISKAYSRTMLAFFSNRMFTRSSCKNAWLSVKVQKKKVEPWELTQPVWWQDTERMAWVWFPVRIVEICLLTIVLPTFWFLTSWDTGYRRWNFKRGKLRLHLDMETNTKTNGLSPRANYTDRATAACRRSDCQLLRIRVPRGQRDGSLRP